MATGYGDLAARLLLSRFAAMWQCVASVCFAHVGENILNVLSLA